MTPSLGGCPARHVRVAGAHGPPRSGVGDPGAPPPGHRPRVGAPGRHGRAQHRTVTAARLASRFDPAATGLLLTLTLVVLVVGGYRARRARPPRTVELESVAYRPLRRAVGRAAHDRVLAVDARLRHVVRRDNRHRRCDARGVHVRDDPAAQSMAPGVPHHGRARSDDHGLAGQGVRRPRAAHRESTGPHARAVVPERPHHRCRGMLRRVYALVRRTGAARNTQAVLAGVAVFRSRSPSPRRACCSACTG